MVNQENEHGNGVIDFLWYVMMGMIPYTIPMVAGRWMKERNSDSINEMGSETVRPLTTVEKTGFVVGILGDIALITAIVAKQF